MDTGRSDIQECGVPSVPHAQNVPSSSILSQLDVAITFAETALSAPDGQSARRSIVFARQLLDGVERSLDDRPLECRASPEIESRLDWLRVLLRECNEGHRQLQDKAIDTHPRCDGLAPEPDVETLPEHKPTETARELPTEGDVRRDLAEVLNCHLVATEPQALCEQIAWRSLLLGLLNDFSAWLIRRPSYRLVLRAPWPNPYRWLIRARTLKLTLRSKPLRHSLRMDRRRRGRPPVSPWGTLHAQDLYAGDPKHWTWRLLTNHFCNSGLREHSYNPDCQKNKRRKVLLLRKYLKRLGIEPPSE